MKQRLSEHNLFTLQVLLPSGGGQACSPAHVIWEIHRKYDPQGNCVQGARSVLWGLLCCKNVRSCAKIIATLCAG